MSSDLLKVLGIDEAEVGLCPDCGAREVRVAVEIHRVEHTLVDGVVEVEIPLWTCGACSFAYTDGRGGAIEQEAVERHLRDRGKKVIKSKYGMRVE